MQTYEVAQMTRIIFENAFFGISEQARSREYFERNDCQHAVGRFGKIGRFHPFIGHKDPLGE